MDSHRVRIVIADDDPVVLREIAAFLETRFDVVGRVTNGRELIDAVEKLAPAVVVTDISMPTMSGLEATRHIRRLYPHIPVIILSAHSDDVIRAAATEVGASSYVLKGRAFTDLFNAIDAALATGDAP